MSELRPFRERLAGLILGGAFVFVFLALVGHIVVRFLGEEGPVVGDVAPTFTLDSPIDGERIATDTMKGMVLLVDFWEMTCVGCVGATPKLNRLFDRYVDRGFLVIGVNREVGEEVALRAFVEERKIRYPVVIDPGFVSEMYDVYATPTVVLIGGDGRIRAIHTGPVTEEKLAKEIEAALEAAKRPVEVGALLLQD